MYLRVNKTKLFSSICMVATILFSIGCAQTSKTVKGGAIGASAGAAIGGVIGNNNGKTGKGIAIGAALGGVAGAAIGKYMENQEEKLEKDLGDDAEIEVVGEELHLTFDSGILFELNSATLSQTAKNDIAKMSTTLQEYPDTYIVIEGHTDASGSEAYNMQLSKERADAVKDYARMQGIDSNRLITKGMGEEEPVASNETEYGRKQNRRVELIILANEELRKDAADGEISD